MERIRTAAFTGDLMLAMPMLGTPASSCQDEREQATLFPQWVRKGSAAPLSDRHRDEPAERGRGSVDLYHPLRRAVKRKIAEMTHL